MKSILEVERILKKLGNTHQRLVLPSTSSSCTQFTTAKKMVNKYFYQIILCAVKSLPLSISGN